MNSSAQTSALQPESKLGRYHVFTDQGRKIKWAPNAQMARKAIENHGFKVLRVVEQPNPLRDFEELQIAKGAL